MAMLVKHRGGGPFGPGRLSSAEEVQELEDSLVDALATFRDVDFGGLDPETGASEPNTPLPQSAAKAKETGLREQTDEEKVAMQAHQLISGGGSRATSNYMEQLEAAKAARAANNQ
jgi:hypothetical protein